MVDAITGLVTAVAELFDWKAVSAQPLDWIMIFLAAAAFFSTKRKKVFVLALVLTVAAAVFAKDFFNEPRPCQQLAPLPPGCPTSPGFPSSHAAVAIVFLLASINSPAFAFFLVAALLVAWSRVYLGMHSVEQATAGIALGALVYFLVLEASDALTKALTKTKTEAGKEEKEGRRKKKEEKRRKEE